MFDFIRNISPTELLIIVLILVLLFGAKIMTRVARMSGETVKEIKKAKSEFTKSIESDGKPSKNS